MGKNLLNPCKLLIIKQPRDWRQCIKAHLKNSLSQVGSALFAFAQIPDVFVELAKKFAIFSDRSKLRFQRNH